MVTTDNRAEHESQGVDPGAFDRVKREREQFASKAQQYEQEAVQAKQALQQIGLVDDLYQSLRGLKPDQLPEGLRPGWESRDFYALAKTVAPQVTGSENPAEAALSWLSDMSSLLSAPGGTQRQAPPPPMAGGPNPAADGVVVESGPFKVGSPQYREFVQQHGDAATRQAIAEGQFYFSNENLAAQESAYSL